MTAVARQGAFMASSSIMPEKNRSPAESSGQHGSSAGAGSWPHHARRAAARSLHRTCSSSLIACNLARICSIACCDAALPSQAFPPGGGMARRRGSKRGDATANGTRLEVVTCSAADSGMAWRVH
jgi:hypothetical protein